MRRTLGAAAVAVCLLVPAVLPVAAAADGDIAIGTYTPNTYKNPGLIDDFGRMTGREPVIVNAYKDWNTPAFNPDELNAAWNRGAVPMVTWEPMTTDGAGISLRRIAAGGEDGHIWVSARAAAAWGKPIFVRFAHEMNGNWFPWGYGVNGNTAKDFRLAWRRVVGVTRAAGADNVRFVWCPNEHARRFPIEPFYPGDTTVDWLCLDGFNFGRDNEWRSFTSLFGNSYNRLVDFTSKPLMIGETASVEEGGDKAEWIASAFEREAPLFDNLRAIVWWNVNDGKHGDFRVNSSPASMRAVRKAFADPVYGATRRDLLSVPASLPASAPAPDQPEEGYGNAASGFIDEVTDELSSNPLKLAIVVGIGVLIIAGFGYLVFALARRWRQGAEA